MFLIFNPNSPHTGNVKSHNLRQRFKGPLARTIYSYFTARRCDDSSAQILWNITAVLMANYQSLCQKCYTTPAIIHRIMGLPSGSVCQTSILFLSNPPQYMQMAFDQNHKLRNQILQIRYPGSQPQRERKLPTPIPST